LVFLFTNFKTKGSAEQYYLINIVKISAALAKVMETIILVNQILFRKTHDSFKQGITHGTIEEPQNSFSRNINDFNGNVFSGIHQKWNNRE